MVLVSPRHPNVTHKFNRFSANVPLLYPLKTSENIWFSNDFRGYRSGILAENRLNLGLMGWWKLVHESLFSYTNITKLQTILSKFQRILPEFDKLQMYLIRFWHILIIYLFNSEFYPWSDSPAAMYWAQQKAFLQ